VNTSDVEEIWDQQRKRNELPSIHRPNVLCSCAVSHVTQLAGKKRSLHSLWSVGWIPNASYPTLPTPPYPPRISFHISSWYLFLVYFLHLILHIFLIIIIIIRCSGMFHVPAFIDGRCFIHACVLILCLNLISGLVYGPPKHEMEKSQRQCKLLSQAFCYFKIKRSGHTLLALIWNFYLKHINKL